DPLYRATAREKSLDDLPRARPQQCPMRSVSSHDGARPGLWTGVSPQAGEVGHEPGTEGARGARSKEAVLARADRRAPTRRSPRGSGDVGVNRDDLPVPLCAVPWSAPP